MPKPRRPRRTEGRQGARGLALLAMLLLVAILGTASMMTVQVWGTQAQRAREAELLAVGTEMRAAMQAYMRNTPSGPPQLPVSLDDLVLDRRYPNPVRYLRRVYDDPFTGKPDWALVRSGAGVIGFYSHGNARPLKQAGFPSWATGFDRAQSVGEWRFVVEAPAGSATPAAPAASSPTPR